MAKILTTGTGDSIKAPRFSVIIAVYNGADTLARAIRSVLEQSYPACELIVIDDGSTDGTRAVATGFGERIRYHYQGNAGVSTARNQGAELARGDWLAFLDADDWYYPERLAHHARFIRDDPDLDFLTGDFDYVDPDGGLLRRSLESTPAGQVLLELNGRGPRRVMQGAVLGQFVAQHFGDTHTLSLPRTTFLALGGYPVAYTVCEDVNFLIRLCAQSRRVGVVTEPLAAYCIHPDSATRHDPLRAQRQTLAALSALKPELADAPDAIRRGLKGALRHARLDLAFYLLRQGCRARAIAAVAPMLLQQPGYQSLRDLLSIMKGLPKCQKF